MATPAELVASALQRWRNNLIDLTRRNPLLSLKTNRTSYLEIVQPDLRNVYEHLHVNGKDWKFFLPAEADKRGKRSSLSSPPGKGAGGEGRSAKISASPPSPPAPLPEGEGRKANELLAADTDRPELLRILTNLYRRALNDYHERGLHILHLALGILEWRDAEDEVFRSPLVLLPVKLDRHSLAEPFRLRGIDEEPIVNPALTARLKQDFGFSLPPAPADWDEKRPDQYLAEVASVVGSNAGWAVHPSVVLTLFSFFKGVIFQDLQDNAERVQAHPIVQALASAPAALTKIAPLDEKDLDAAEDARRTYFILDADASQRLCLDAAARAESYVLIGPPGTGKSQTIANLIADRIAQGKKVLFVSEKMAALEVVYNRLCDVGLGEFCLELHSHKANKREVVKELARCFEETLIAQPMPTAQDFARLNQRRDQLNKHVQALHQLRQPMNRSVWDALAQLPRWQSLPMAPLGLPALRQAGDTTTKLVLAEFTPAHLDELQQLLQRLQQHWHIRAEPNYPWRGFKAERYSLQLRDEVVGLIDKVRGRDEKLRTAADQYAGRLGLKGTIPELLRLGDLLEKRPPAVAPGWLTAADLPALIRDFDQCAEQYQRLGQARQPLTERYGPALWKQAGGASAKIEQAWQTAAALLAPGDDRGAEFLKQQAKLRAWAAETQKRIPGWLTELRALQKWLTVPLPVGAGSTAAESGSEMKVDPSVDSLRAFVRLANLGASDLPVEKSWLEDRGLLKDALAYIAGIKPTFLRFKQNRQHLLKIYEEKLFKLDLERIGRAYAGPYQGWLCIFSWQYRKDRRAIAKCRPLEDVPATVAHDMQLGAEAHADRARIEADQARRSRLLGRYDKGLDTDIDAAENAAKHADEALDLAGQLDCERLPPKCLEALLSNAPAEKIRAAIKRLNESFAAWLHLTQELQATLPTARLALIDDRLEECALSALANYAKQLQGTLNQFAGLADPLLSGAAPADMLAFVADLKQAEELLAWEAAQATEAERWTREFGAAFQGVGTDWEALRKALTWTRRLREALGALQGGAEPIPPVTSDALLQAATATAPSSRELRQALEPYEHALHGLEIRYDAPGPQFDGKQLREHPPETVFEVLTKWRDRVGELADWVDWRYLPERFQHLGLKPFWDHLQQHDMVREQVVGMFLKSFWSAWLDTMFQLEPALREYRRPEQEAWLREFRELDRKIIAQGAGRIAAILDPLQSKRGPDDVEVALLMKEAHKKSKHLPLRQLFDTAPSLMLQLKPCMLMSPLSVSQFLPSDPAKLQFDLVVFDEASQILPEDAVGAIYRGKQVVITGDNQQLPPTTFFQQNADDGAEEEETPLFESILDASLGAGLPRRMLRWHYRSQHEHLIAFSNKYFYEGRLVTFPSAALNDESLGVQLCHVADGVYDRGGKRDNPREAQAVAEIVLNHFRQTPKKTIGVIAFSYAQMNAIEDEIERRLREAPNLERFLKSDRLEGFFVKNLETVQGDERDVIVLSVGYGRDALGKIELNFGPLNREGGERRLNVAVTRARQRLLVVSSIRARDLNLGKTEAKGLAHLQRYLDFAERGMSALTPESAAAPLPLTGLHEDVMAELTKLGCEAVPFVGCGACRLDVGVRDPEQPGRFVLGIQFDGPMYAQTSTARDRERLRDEVLTRLGWTLHRIAAADWVHRKEEEIARLRDALSKPG